MLERITVPFLHDDVLRRKAHNFLTKYHPTGTLPVPIEQIVDLRLRINIVPIPGLKSTFEVDAYTSRDMESIYVDQYTAEHRPARYRFSLGHEVAHAFLHQKIFTQLTYDGIEGWKRAQEAFSDSDYSRLEYQANLFAGLVLVPPESLATYFNSACQLARHNGLDVLKPTEQIQDSITGALARNPFEVSADVVSRRIRSDGLWGATSFLNSVQRPAPPLRT